jgi:hypothetical protein
MTRPFNPEVLYLDHDPPHDPDHGASEDYAYVCLILFAFAVVTFLGIAVYGLSRIFGL